MLLSDLELHLLVRCGTASGDGETEIFRDMDDHAREEAAAALARLEQASLIKSGELRLNGRAIGDDGRVLMRDQREVWWQITDRGIVELDAQVAAERPAGAPRVPRIRLYLMTDYTSSSLWWESGRMAALDGLPLSAGTCAALVAWSERMFEALYAEIGDGPSIDLDAYHAEMTAEGDRLLRVLRAELPARYEVGRARFGPGVKYVDWEDETTSWYRDVPDPA